MLQIGFLRRDWREILGQLFRIPSGYFGSLIGIYPSGNTGGSDVSPFRSMPIPDDLRSIIESEKKKTED